MADLDKLKAALADRYTIERELGSGGMAIVYLAQDLKHHRKVAIKVLRSELSASLFAERFLREIEISANLNHPHILPMHDSGEADGSLFYVMPYVEGESLRDRLNREKQLPVDDAMKIASEVADALDYAHSHDVIHRDVKPENIMLESGHAVVADFGIARAVTEAGGERLTETGVAVGTPAYLSPEQASGERELDGRSDVYSLGCVLHEMLAGEPPFTGPTAENIIRKHISAEPTPVSVLRPTVSDEMALTVARSLAKAPADRFATARQFAEAVSADRVSTASLPAREKRRARRITLLGVAAVVVIAGAVMVSQWIRFGGTGTTRQRTAIAVLPFENLSADGPYAYFADGLHDELLTQLAKVAALSVRGRTSVMSYMGTTKSIKQIAEELEVGTLLVASTQVVGDRLRVNVQLIDATTDEHLWADSYDRTLDDAFAIQSDVAEKVVMAVGAALAESEKQLITVAPTANAEAYRLYLQGQEYYNRPGYERQNWEIAQQLYERALGLDSTFALAHAALSQVLGIMWRFRYNLSPEQLVRQREEAEMALRLAPELPHSHLAMGYAQYMGRRDWQAALDEYDIALQGLPNDAELWTQIGYAHRRLGNWGEVDAAFEKITQLDPRNANRLMDMSVTYRVTRRYAEAIAADDRALTLAPDLHAVAVGKGLDYLLWKGEADTLRAALEQLPPDAELVAYGTVRAQRARLLLWERKPDSLLAVLGSAPDAVFGGYEALLPTSLYAAWAHQLRGDDAVAHAAFDSARVLLDSMLAVLSADKWLVDGMHEALIDELWRVHGARGLALAGLGERQEALREARWLQESVVYRDDALDRRLIAEQRALILAQAGEADAALDEIEQLLTRGAWSLSVHTLRLDPRWDPIRDHPRFQTLLAKYEN